VLTGCDRPLSEAYDLAMLDLDGVVYVGPDPVPGAPDHLRRAREHGMRLAYVTNNASRPPTAVAAHLRHLGIELDDADVVTSAQAAARLLAERLPEGSTVFVIGGRGLDEALRERGLRPVQDRDERPSAVVSGFSADLRWGTVIAGAILVREGLTWVASNTDATVPTPHGPGPGNGALVEVVARFAGRDPVVAGKPEPPLMRETQLRAGGEHPLVVGDRLDTDIEGARRSGFDSLLVMTGVTDVEVLAGATPEQRPTYVAADLGALARPQPVSDEADGVVADGPWQGRVDGDGRVHLERAGERAGPPSEGPEVVDAWWRVLATTAWRHLDATGRVADVSTLTVPGSVDGQD
jgi:glycerol 3-phosphatase-2